MVRWRVFLPTAALLLLAARTSSVAGETLNPGDYAKYNRNYVKIGIIVWDEDLGVGNQGDCSKFANHMMEKDANLSPLSYPDVDAYANITVGWETCTMDFRSMWFKAASLMADPDVNSRLPAESPRSEGKILLLASKIRDILCGPILPSNGVYTETPFGQYDSSSAWVYEILESSPLFSDVEMTLDPQWTPGGISSVIQTTAPDMITITGAHDVYGFLTSGVISPKNPVKAGCMNITFGPLKQIFQVLVWNGPNSAAPDLYDFKVGTEPPKTCTCSTDCGATEVYPRVCAGANVSLEVIRGLGTSGTDVCSLQPTGSCLSHSDCQVENSVPRMCIQSSYEARSGTYSPGETNAGSCYLCPNGTAKTIAAQNLFGTCYSLWGTDRSRYPYTETSTQGNKSLIFPSRSDFCPNTFSYVNTGNSGNIDEFAPAFCASTPYCTSVKGKPGYSDDGVKLCYNTWNVDNTIATSLKTLYQCVAPYFVPLNTLGDNWAWNHALLGEPINELYSLINTTALEGPIPPGTEVTRARATCVADQSGIFLNTQTTVCPPYLIFFNLVDYESTGLVEGGNVDIFYPCFKIQNDENVNPNLLYGNCAEKKTNQSSWVIHTKHSSGGAEAERDGARYAIETDSGLLYNSHLPYNRATCQENGYDKFYVFIGTNGDYRTNSKTPRDIVQLEGFDLITDHMCMQWYKGIRNNILSYEDKSYLLPRSAYLTDDEMKLVLYAANKQTARPTSSCSGTPPWINMTTVRSSPFIGKVHACIKPLCKLTNQTVEPTIWSPNSNEYADELTAYAEIILKNKTECSGAQGAYWDGIDGMCMPRQMSMGLRLQESVTCILEALTDSKTSPVISFEPVGNDTAKDYSFLANTFSNYHYTKKELVGVAYNEIQDVLLHVPLVNDSETPKVVGKIDHGMLANKICPQYQISNSSYYFIDNIGDFISNSLITPANYAATLQADQRKKPGVAAEVVFVDGKSNSPSPLPRALFRTNMLRNMIEATNIITPQIQATLPTFTVFSNTECTRTSSDKGTAIDLAYVCVQITYDAALAETIVPPLAMNYSKLCQLVTQKMIAPVDYDKVLPAVTLNPAGSLLFNKTLTDSLGYSSDDFVADSVLLQAITGINPSDVQRDNGCVTAPGIIYSLRLWEKDTSVYFDATRERSAEAWFPCINSVGTTAYSDFGVGSEPYENPLIFPDTHVTEGVCVPCPHFNASDTNAQKSGAGCDAGELGYCAAVYNCDDGFFCADVIASGDTISGPVVPGVCTDQGSCQDRDPIFGRAKTSMRDELSYCSAQSQTAVVYFYDQPESITSVLPCIGDNAFLLSGFSGAGGRFIDEETQRPYAKLVIPFDCANSNLLRDVYSKFSQRISNVDLFGANYADGEKLDVGTYYQFFNAFCGNNGNMKSVGTSRGSLPDVLEKYIRRFESRVTPTVAKIPDGKTDQIYSGWCVSMTACNDCTAQRVVGGLQIVPGNQFRLAFQAGAIFPGGEEGSLGDTPVNSSSFVSKTSKRGPGGNQSFFLSELTKLFPGVQTIFNQEAFWNNISPDERRQVFDSHRTLKALNYTHLGFDSTMTKLNYTLFDYIPQTAGCAIPRPIYAPNLAKLDDLAAFIATMLGIDLGYAEALAKGDLFNPKENLPSLYPDITRTPYLNMNLKSFNAYEMNADSTNNEILTLMFPEFCYWTSSEEYTGNFTEVSREQKNFLAKIVRLQNFDLLDPETLIPNPFEINVIETMCRPLWDNDFDKDVFWKATMLVKDTNIFDSGQQDASFSSDPTVEAEVNYTTLTPQERYNYEWFRGLEIEQPLETPLKTTYFLKAVGDITGDSIQSFAPTYHKFLGPTLQSGNKWINPNNNFKLPEELLSYSPDMVTYTNQYETLNSMCLTNIGSSQTSTAAVFGAQITVYSSFELNANFEEALGQKKTINTFLKEGTYVGGFQCNKADSDEESIFDNLPVAFPGPCACNETTPGAKADDGCQFIDAPGGPSCPTVPYPTFKPTPAPPTKKPTTPPPTPEPTTLGQLIAAEDEKAEREIGILAAAFFGAVFVLALLVAVLAFVLKSGKSKSEIELNVAYVEKFYQEKEKAKRLLRPFRFARQRKSATYREVGSGHRVSSEFTKTSRRPLNF